IFHWFSGSSDDLQRALHAGCFFSVGPRMLASRRGREYARQIPLDRLLLETDMPARAGEPLPVEIWEAELRNALAGIAQLKDVDPTTLAQQLATTSEALLTPADATS
ncbi:MAG: TatD family hydrolase, partial [Adlercreutzia sp.]|nr:TatD family hydrolase [Adlercreutzia sp.]